MINRIEHNDSAHKLLSDNRASYFAQSANTRNGVRAEFRMVSEYERTEVLDAAPSTDNYDFFEEVGYESFR